MGISTSILFDVSRSESTRSQKRYREKSHYCLIVAIRELYVKDGTMNDELADTLELCMHLRHDADYGLIYDKESAEAAIRYAQQFLSVSKKLL